MKFGIHAGLWMKAWTDDPAPIFKTIADIGYDGAELSLLGIGLDRADDIRAQATDCGLDLTCSTGLGPEADPTSEDAAVRDNAGEIIEGSATEIKRQKDTWAFARKMGSDDPNWLLVSTDA